MGVRWSLIRVTVIAFLYALIEVYYTPISHKYLKHRVSQKVRQISVLSS